jgi:hypothetical protein
LWKARLKIRRRKWGWGSKGGECERDKLIGVSYDSGRKLGAGVKVAGRMLKKKLDAAQGAQGQGAGAGAGAGSGAGARPTGGETVSRAKAGGKAFASSVIKPLGRAGHVLWLEITGVLFAMFVLVFAGALWKFRDSAVRGTERGKFVLVVVLTVLFAYFSVTSFVRARKRERR